MLTADVIYIYHLLLCTYYIHIVPVFDYEICAQLYFAELGPIFLPADDGYLVNWVINAVAIFCCFSNVESYRKMISFSCSVSSLKWNLKHYWGPNNISLDWTSMWNAMYIKRAPSVGFSRHHHPKRKISAHISLQLPLAYHIYNACIIYEPLCDSIHYGQYLTFISILLDGHEYQPPPTMRDRGGGGSIKRKLSLTEQIDLLANVDIFVFLHTKQKTKTRKSFDSF